MKKTSRASSGGKYVTVSELGKVLKRSFSAFGKRQNEKFGKFFTMMDAFLKRTGQNEQEIMFLGRQHDAC